MRIRIGKKTSKTPTQGQVFGGHCHNFIRGISGILKTVVLAPPPRRRKNLEKHCFFMGFLIAGRGRYTFTQNGTALRPLIFPRQIVENDPPRHDVFKKCTSVSTDEMLHCFFEW